MFRFSFFLQDVQLDLDVRSERLASLTKELEEMTDVQMQTRIKNELELKVKDQVQFFSAFSVFTYCINIVIYSLTVLNLNFLLVGLQEEALNELAGQVQMLASARLRLKMAMEQMKKENCKELAQRDEEMEDTRCSAQKKVKGQPVFL
jgi:myosin-18